MSVEDKINQCRHMILSIAGGAYDDGTNVDLAKLLKLLSKISTGEIRDICRKLLKDRLSYLNSETWMFTICWKLSLDKTENLTLL
jgi:hypothetical protein